MRYQYWLMASVIFIICEILPPPTHFFFVCMAIGALMGSIAALFSTLNWLPWVVFAVTTVALCPLLIPLAKFLFTPKQHLSNVDALIGRKAIVLMDMDGEKAGQVKVGSEAWRAVSRGEKFEKGSTVIIEKVEGASLVVRRPS